MVSTKDFIKKIEDFTTPLLDKEGIELVDIEWVKEPAGRFLRFFIDKEGGVNLDTCAKMSEVLSRALDQVNIISDPCTLEVSSPGIERPLKKLEHFRRHINSEIYVKLFKPIENQKEFEGILKSVYENGIVLEFNKKLVEISFDLIAKAHPVVRFF
ncbi:MAG: ribosome maturation factor RimP [Actinobacteria bacterium]|nr:ribosome maturation factor RimP [Actinomycetota bacterium]